jgi:propionyl-CoA synthetase
VTDTMRTQGYDATYEDWMGDPNRFWLRAAELIDWAKRPTRSFDGSLGPYGRWFDDGALNTSYNCLDRHVSRGRGNDPALIFHSAMSDRKERFSFEELLDRTARFAGGLAARGVRKGDRVLIYMPMIPEAVIAMLACARLGAIHSVVFGGFAAPELAKRLLDARPTAVVLASCGLEPGRVVSYKPILEEAFAIAGIARPLCIVHERDEARAVLVENEDVDFQELANAPPHPPVEMGATDPLYILYTSGTTGKPKGIVRDNGGHAVALMMSMHMVYGLRAGDVCFTASDIGWVVGHSYIVYGPLLAGCTTILYEGKPVGTPDAGAFWNVLASYGARTLFTAPTAIRAIRQADPDGLLRRAHDLSRLDAVFLAGERCDPATSDWLSSLLQIPVIDHWWQTETGWPITANFRGLGLFRTAVGSAGRSSPGFRLRVLATDGTELGRGEIGTLVLDLPLPPGAAPTLWNDNDGFINSYLRAFPGYYCTADAGKIDDAGNVWVLGRTDDIINVAGHRLSTGALEEVVGSHPAVVECAVIAVADSIKGEIPIGLFVLRQDFLGDAITVSSEIVDLVRNRIGPVASFRAAIPVRQLLKTRSGKILRGTIRELANGEEPCVPATIDDPAAIDVVKSSLNAWQTGRS